ncbi:MAG TPA: Ti-type conjugative transfer relaxase TraA [Allosphingosinicella sp.]|nr:Ti-type conjugative transfer relaxase TraA [Allosphingosinicella sp.]
MAMFVHRHSEGKDQFDGIMGAIRASREVVYVGKDGRGEERFTSREMLATEQRLGWATAGLEARRMHAVGEQLKESALARAEARGMRLSLEQNAAFQHVTEAKGLGTVIGYAGTGKSAMLGVARDSWEAAGYQVQGTALSGIAAENLESGSGIQSRTLAGLEHQWAQGRDQLSANHVLVIDEAGMIGSRQMERVITQAEKRGAKVVLVGDPEQLQAIEAGAAFRSIAERHGSVEIRDIRRQQEGWQRSATRQLATGRTAEAVDAYDRRGHVHAAETRDEARQELIDRWDKDRAAEPQLSRIILTHTNEEVQALNGIARERLRGAGELGEDVTLTTDRGARQFAAGDRIMFLRNERSLGVKNGSLGRVDSVAAARMAVMLDNGRAIEFDVKEYAAIDHGYAATVHKAQGVTVDRTHVLATPGLDRHSAYVALSRHRGQVGLHYGRDDFADRGQLARTLSRDRPKDMASDYVKGFASTRAIIMPEAAVREILGRADLPIERAATQDAAKCAERREPRQSALERAVQRFAAATGEMVRTLKAGPDEQPKERAAFEEAKRALEEVRPGGPRDLYEAFTDNMGLIDEAAAGRTRAAIRAMVLQAELRQDPHARADRFVAEWRRLGDRHEAFERAGDERGAGRVADQMRAFAKQLERDPQVESLLRTRDRELGVPPYLTRPLSQALPNWIGWGRGREIER